ncbi:MAG: hypothetical protein WCC74_00615 [Minisyncoccia bacterium]
MSSSRDIGISLSKRRKIVFARKILVILSITVILLVAFAWFSGSGFWNVDKIEIVGVSTLNTNEISKNVQNIIDGRYFYLFSKSNILILPYFEIKNSLQKYFPKIDSISLRMTGNKSVRVTVLERHPVGLWCKSKERRGGGCYFLDRSGYIYSEAPDFSGNPFFYFFGENIFIPIGQFYIENPKFLRLYSFMQRLKDMGFEPVSLSAILGGEYEIDLSHGGVIYFNEDQAFETSLEIVDSMLQNGIISTSTDFLSKLNHLDLRYGNKVHFDYKK